MSLRQFFTPFPKAEADRSPLEDDKAPTYTSNVTTAGHPHTLSGHDSIRLPDKSESSLTDTLALAETSEVATPTYSKRPSDKFKFYPPLLICMNFVSILPGLR